MTKVGASGTDLARVEEYRSKKMAQILEDNLSSLRDFQKALSGDAGGVTLANQLASAEATFNGFKTDILAGKTVDQDKFTAAGSEVNSLASQLYGSSTSQYQAYRSDLNSVTAALIHNITKAVNGDTAGKVMTIDPQVTAVTDQTTALVAVGNTTNDLLRQVIEKIGVGGLAVNDNGSVSQNGRVAMY